MSTLKMGVDHRLHATHRRHARYRASRKQRRQLGVMWAILAAVTLLIAWDVAGRMDEVLYNPPFLG